MTDPSNVQLAAITGGIRVTWTEGANPGKKYEVWSQLNSDAYEKRATVITGLETYDDIRTLAGGDVVKYKVKCYEYSDYSDYSNTVNIPYVAPPALISDGNTVAWYKYDDASTFTLAGASVTQWSDKLASGHDIKQSNPALKPTLTNDGVLFTTSLLISDAFTLNQPEFVYIVFRQITWTVTAFIFNGVGGEAKLWQNGGGTSITMKAGSDTGGISMPLNTWGVVRALFNGANSTLQLDNGYKITINPGTGNAGGFLMGAVSNGAGNYANIEVKEVIVRKTADSLTDQATLFNYLQQKYQTPNQLLNLVFDGDSLIAGFGASESNYWNKKVRDNYLSTYPNILSTYCGIAGQSTTQMLSDITTQILPLTNPLVTDVIVAWEDVNAILNNGRTALQNYNDMVDYFTQCQTAGYDIRILILGYYPRKVNGYYPGGWDAPKFQAQKDYFDMCVAAVSPPWTDIIDLRNDAIIGGAEGQAYNPTYFLDTVHLLDAGYNRITPLVIEKINGHL
jgi:hypothetical protein